MLRSPWLFAAIALLPLGFGGCGSSNSVWVTCEFTKNGAPFTAPNGQVVQVTFYALDAKDESGKAVANKQPFPAAPLGDGKFEVPGPDGSGVPPGKYRIAVTQTPKDRATAPATKSRKLAPDRDHDFLEGRFGPDTSPIERTIERSEHVIFELNRPAS